MRTYTWQVEDPVDNPESLASAIAELERRCGCAVSCDALDGRLRRQRRDEYLQAAHALMTGTPWGRCVELETEIHRFEARVWPRWRDRETPPEECSALRRYLFQARRLGPLPSTARQLWNIVMKRGGGCDFSEKAVQSPPDPR